MLILHVWFPSDGEGGREGGRYSVLSLAEVQTDSFSFECRGCTRMKELELELEQLRLLVVAVVGREQVVCASGSGEGTVDKVGENDERC